MATLDSLKQVKDFNRSGALLAIDRVAGRKRLLLGSSDFHVYDLDLSQPRPEFKIVGRHESYVTGVAALGGLAVSGGYDGKLLWWDLDKRSLVRSVEAHARWIRRVVASPDSRCLASVADDMVCRLWDAGTGKLLREFRGHKEKTPHHFPSMLYAVAFSPDGKLLATGDKVGHVVVWDVAAGTPVATLEAPVMYTWDAVQRRHSIGGIRSLAFSPDGKRLAVGGMGKVGNIDHLEGKTRVEVFDWQKAQRTHEFAGDKFSGLVTRLIFHPRGDWLLGAGGANDGFLLFFDLASNKVLRQEKAGSHIHDAVRNDAADTIYTAGHGKLLIFEVKG